MYYGFASYIYQDKLPLKNLSTKWESIIRGWAVVLNKKVEDLDQALTIDKFAQKISELSNLKQLENTILKDDTGKPIVGSIELLNKFFGYVLSINRTQIFDALSLLPNQNGIFQLRRNLKSDSGIDETLKDVAKEMGIDIRESLLNSSVSQEANKLLNPMTQDELLNQILKTIKEQAKSNPSAENFKKANLQLFNWLVNNKKYEQLKDYPVFRAKSTIKTRNL